MNLENIKQERKELAKYLRRGDRANIARTAGVARQTVERWLKGLVITSSAEPYILEWVERRKKEMQAALEGALNSNL